MIEEFYERLGPFEFGRDVIRLSLKRVFLEHSSGRVLCCMVWVMHRWWRGILIVALKMLGFGTIEC